MSPHRNLGDGNHDQIDTPADVRPVPSDSYRRDKAKLTDWTAQIMVLLMVALITGAFIAHSNFSDRMVRMETQIDYITKQLEQIRGDRGTVAGTPYPPRNAP